MKALLLTLIFSFIILGQTNDKTIWWDLDGDEIADEAFTASLNDTITAKLYITSFRESDSIYAVDFLARYGHQPYWLPAENSQNCLTFLDTTALRNDSTEFRITTYGQIRMDIFAPSKKVYFTWSDTASALSDKRALNVDTMLISFDFKCTSRGKQILEILPADNNVLDNLVFTGGTNIFGYGNVWKPYSLTIKNCVITVE